MKTALQHLREIIPFLPEGGKAYIIRYCITSSLLALLDVAALALLALSLSGMLQGTAVTLPLLGRVESEGFLWVILAVATLILSKSALQILQQWRVTRRYATFELEIGRRLFLSYMSVPWEQRVQTTMAKSLRMVDVGVSSVNAGLLIPLTGLPAMFSTTTLILLVLLVANPVTAVVTFAYLAAVGVVLYVVLAGRTVTAGKVNRRYAFRVADLMAGMLGAMKEITLQKKIDEVSEVLLDNRKRSTRARANINFLQAVPKFVLDVSLIGGFLVIGVVSYLFSRDMTTAFSSIALFGVAGLRLVPALTTFQSANNLMSSNAPQVEIVIADLQAGKDREAQRHVIGQEAIPEGVTSLNLENVSFTYPGASAPAVDDVTLEVPFGTSIGFVGESGSGKSTLVDIILGFLGPQEGRLMLGTENLVDVLDEWRSTIGYVAQDVALFQGTVAQNVALTWSEDIDYDQVEVCLKKARLWETIEARPGKMKAEVADRGAAFSGGQRQRFGIARALYHNPEILILDEATSALDTKTEAGIVEAINALAGEITVISVAHRLSTVKNVDKLCYFEDGNLIAQGKFDEVVAAVPGFREQATLAGLVASNEDAEQAGQ